MPATSAGMTRIDDSDQLSTDLHIGVLDHLVPAIDFLAQISRLVIGRRVVVSITEITGVSDNLITTQEMFRHEVQIDASGKEVDRWIGLGFHPHSHKLEPFRQQLRESLYGDF